MDSRFASESKFQFWVPFWPQFLSFAAIVTPSQDFAFMLTIFWTALNLLIANFFILYRQMTLYGLSQLRYISAMNFAFQVNNQHPVEGTGRMDPIKRGQGVSIQYIQHDFGFAAKALNLLLEFNLIVVIWPKGTSLRAKLAAVEGCIFGSLFDDVLLIGISNTNRVV